MSRPPAPLLLVLVRHGATSWNENRYCQGRREVQLSARGRLQAERLRQALESTPFRRVFSSPMVRAVETARLLGHEPLPLGDLLEIDRGHWEGHTPEEIRKRWPKLHEAWYRDPAGLAMPGGEEFDQLWSRAGRVLERCAGELEGPILICGHKAINRAILARALGLPPAKVWGIPQPQACRSLLTRTDRGWEAGVVGDASHLPEALRSED
ncbi:MAG: histidine phosphatase family protein [Planctomycetaceae bacterium]